MKKIILLFCFVFTLVMLGACSDSEKTSSDNSKKSEEVKTKGKLKADDYEKLYSDPKKYKGYEVELTGKIFTEPEKDDDGTYLQMWGDPENSEKNTVIAINDSKLKVKTDDYIKVDGIVQDKFEGENAFGGTVLAPVIKAKSIKVVDYITAVSPTIKEIKVNKDINQHDIILTLEKIELAKNQTRLYVKIKNKTKDNVSFYSNEAKLIVGNKQLEEEYADPETTGLKELQSELLPGVESEGVIVYPAISINEKKIRLNAKASSDNYDIDFKPFVFEIQMK